jgi:small subunit ribosomal protein S7
MSRRSKPNKRVILPDVRYNSVHVQSFVNRILRNGKRSTALGLVYGAFDLIEQRLQKPPLDIFEAAIKNVGPMMEVRPRRVGGATYQVPLEVPAFRRFALASRWIIQSAKSRSCKSFEEKLAAELMDAANNQGASVRKREEVHKMAEANRAYSHYRM